MCGKASNKNMSAETQSQKIIISDELPLHTELLRSHEVFLAADRTSEVPDVILASGVANPRDRPRPTASRIGIHNTAGQQVGAFNLVQTQTRSWINDVAIRPERRGEKLAVASYLGVIAAGHSVGRVLESDPMGLSEHSAHLWESLVKRGVAQQTESADQHGHPRFVSLPRH
jgi:hypothetical protein